MIVIKIVVLEVQGALTIQSNSFGEGTATPNECKAAGVMSEHNKVALDEILKKSPKGGAITEGPNADQMMANILKNMRP
jgi:hypothetical protein